MNQQEFEAVRAGACLPIRMPIRYRVPNHDQVIDELIKIAGIKEIAMPTIKIEMTKRPLDLLITQGENGYQVIEQAGPGHYTTRRWFALNADQLGKLLVKLAKEARPISKV